MYRISHGVHSTQGPDYGVVLDVRRGELFNLNTAGARILELLKADVGEREIVDRIGIEFEIDFATAERDVRDFLTALQQHGLIEERVA